LANIECFFLYHLLLTVTPVNNKWYYNDFEEHAVLSTNNWK